MTIDLNGTRVWIAELCPEIEAWRVDLIVDHIKSQITAEREACAKVCEDISNGSVNAWQAGGAGFCAAAIRKRMEVKP